MNAIEQRAIVAPSVAATMVLIAAAAVAAAWAVVVAEVSEVVAFVEVVAGANGTVGRFRSGGDFPDAPAADYIWGGVMHELDTKVRGLR